MYKKRAMPSNSRPQRKSSIDLSSLQSDNATSHYWLGYLMANCAIANATTAVVTVRIQDREHLDLLRKFFNNSNVMSEAGQKGHQPNRLVYRIVSSDLISYLVSKGVEPDRKKRAIPKFYQGSKAFWRGYLDANSDVDEDDEPPTFHVQGTKAIVQAFASYALDKFSVKGEFLAPLRDVLRYEIVYKDNAAEILVRAFWQDSDELATDYMRQALQAF